MASAKPQSKKVPPKPPVKKKAKAPFPPQMPKANPAAPVGPPQMPAGPPPGMPGPMPNMPPRRKGF